MDAFPPAYVEHNLPFIVLSGLGSQDELDPPPSVYNVLPGRAAVRTSSEIPPVTGERAGQLLQDFLSADGTNAPWNAQGSSRRDLAPSFRIRAVGRVCMSPCADLFNGGYGLMVSRTSFYLPRRQTHLQLQKLPRLVARPSQRRHHGSSIRPSHLCRQEPQSFQTVSSHLPGLQNTRITYLLSSYPSSTSPPTLSRTVCTTIS